MIDWNALYEARGAARALGVGAEYWIGGKVCFLGEGDLLLTVDQVRGAWLLTKILRALWGGDKPA